MGIKDHKIFRRIERDEKLAKIGYYDLPSERIFTDLKGTAKLLAEEKGGKELLNVFDKWYTAYGDVILGRQWKGRRPEDKSILPPPMAAASFAQTWNAVKAVLESRGFTKDEIATAAAVFGVSALHTHDIKEMLSKTHAYRGLWEEMIKARRHNVSKKDLYSPQMLYLWPLNAGEGKKALWKNRFGLRKMKKLPLTEDVITELENLRRNARKKREYYKRLREIIQDLMWELERREIR